MKLRLAKKIAKAIDTPRESAYSEKKLNQALDRIARTKESRETDRFMYAICDLKRAHDLIDEDPAESFRLFMENRITYKGRLL